MLLTHLFSTKVVGDKGECNGSGLMMPQSGGIHTFVILTNLALACIPPGNGVNVIIGLVWGVITCFDCLVAQGMSLSIGIIVGVVVQLIVGTAPGVLLRVTCLCRRLVLIKFCFAVGSRICIIAGASKILVNGI